MAGEDGRRSWPKRSAGSATDALDSTRFSARCTAEHPVSRRKAPFLQLVDLALFVGLLVALWLAIYFSYYAQREISAAFLYQEAVVAAERDIDALVVEQFDRRIGETDLRPYVKLFQSDLDTVGARAQNPEEFPPQAHFPATREAYARLSDALAVREARGRARFADAVVHNTYSRNAGNALFFVVAFLFMLVQARMRRRIDAERALVAGLQRAMLSRRREIRNFEVGGVLLSATRGANVGGDLYEVFPGADHEALFLIADVSGKGLRAAVDTAFVKYSIRTLFFSTSDPAEILRGFSAMYGRSVENPESFVVLFLGVLDLRTGDVRYASAGQEGLRRTAAGEVRRLAPTGPIVGIDPAAIYETGAFRLAPGDAIFLTTDGATESRDQRGDLLGIEGLAAWVASAPQAAQAAADEIVARVRRRSRRISDDLAVLVLRYDPAEGEAPPRADFRT